MGRKTKNELDKDAYLRALQNPITREDIVKCGEKLATSPEYSLEPDPLHALALTDDEKNFIRAYINWRNLPIVADLTGLSLDECKEYYNKLSIKQEIRRISDVMYLRQFNEKMLNIDEIGGYLTAVLQDHVPEADRLPAKDKLAVAKLLIDINAVKREAVDKPNVIDAVDVKEVESLSVDSIKNLISKSKADDEIQRQKEQIIETLDKDDVLSNEDLQFLRNMTLDQLIKLQQDQQRTNIIAATMPDDGKPNGGKK